jgi:hypothetical protein
MNLLSLINISLGHVTVALYCQIMDELGLKDWSRKVVVVCTVSYFLVYI